jgi:hypothetical protein
VGVGVGVGGIGVGIGWQSVLLHGSEEVADILDAPAGCSGLPKSAAPPNAASMSEIRAAVNAFMDFHTF